MKRRPEDFSRRKPGDPHLPHTTHFKERPDVQIPPEAQAVIAQQWPEVVRTFEQYDKGAGMLMLYGCVRDACKAAGWGDDMAYLMRDYLIAKLNKQNVKTYTGTDDSPGDWQVFNMKEALNRSAKYIDKTGKERDVNWITSRGKKKVPPQQQPVESRGARLAAFLLEDDHIPYEKVYGKRITLINPHGQPVKARVTGYVGKESGVTFQVIESPEWPLPGDNKTERQLRQQGWIVPKIVVTDVRNDMLKKLAGDMFARDNPSNPS